MKTISKIELIALAKKTMLNFSNEEIEDLQLQFETNFSQMNVFEKINNLESVEPIGLPFTIEGVFLRDDKVKEHLKSKDVLKNAPDSLPPFVKITKVVD